MGSEMEECWVGSGPRDQDQLQTQFKSQSQLANQTQLHDQYQDQLFNFSMKPSSPSYVWATPPSSTIKAKPRDDDEFTIFDDSWESVNQLAISSDEKTKGSNAKELSEACRLTSASSPQSAPLGALSAQALNKAQVQSPRNQQRQLNQPQKIPGLRPKKSYGLLTEGTATLPSSSLNRSLSTELSTQPVLKSSNGPRRRVTRSLSRHHYEAPPLNVNAPNTNSDDDDDDDENSNDNYYNSNDNNINDNYYTNSNETRKNETQNSDDDNDNAELISSNRANRSNSLLKRQRSHYMRRQSSSEMQSSGRGHRRGSGSKGNGRRARSPGRRCTPRHFEIEPVKSALKSSNSNDNGKQKTLSAVKSHQQLQGDKEVLTRQRSMSTSKLLITRSRSSSTSKSTSVTSRGKQMLPLPLVLPIGFYSKQEMVCRELVNDLIHKQVKNQQQQPDQGQLKVPKSQQIQSSKQQELQRPVDKRGLRKRAVSLKPLQTVPLSSASSSESNRETTAAAASRVGGLALTTTEKKKKGVMWAEALEW